MGSRSCCANSPRTHYDGSDPGHTRLAQVAAPVVVPVPVQFALGGGKARVPIDAPREALAIGPVAAAGAGAEPEVLARRPLRQGTAVDCTREGGADGQALAGTPRPQWASHSHALTTCAAYSALTDYVPEGPRARPLQRAGSRVTGCPLPVLVLSRAGGGGEICGRGAGLFSGVGGFYGGGMGGGGLDGGPGGWMGGWVQPPV